MASLRWTDEAVSWLAEIRSYIEQDNPIAALETVRGIHELAGTLLDLPERGYRFTERDDRHIRILLYGHYRIAYLIRPNGDIDILGVFHGALDIQRYLAR